MRLDVKLEKLCAAKGWNQRELAKAIGVGKSTVHNWFSGRSKPDLDSALNLARALGVPLDYLADDSLDDPPGGLDEGARRVLEAAEVVGWDVALRRIMVAPEVRPTGPTYGDQLDAEREQLRKRGRA